MSYGSLCRWIPVADSSRGSKVVLRVNGYVGCKRQYNDGGHQVTTDDGYLDRERVDRFFRNGGQLLR